MLSYAQRIEHCTNPVAKKLLQIITDKQSNLSLSADVTRAEALLQLADSLGPHICVFKTHIDIMQDASDQMITELTRLAKMHNFLIFEDRKFADIGNTVVMQYEQGPFQIANWAPITNAHIIAGPGTVEGLKQVGLPKGNGLLILAEMSSKGSLCTGDYTEKAIELALLHKDFVFGFISGRKLVDDPGFIHMTPGVRFQSGGALGQQYSTPEVVIGERQSDVIIVGRGIVEADDPLQEALKYKQAGWDAYLKRSS